MAVQKYKPTRTPQKVEKRLEDAIARAVNAVNAARAAVARSKKVVESSKELARSLEAAHRRTSSR